MKQSSAWALGGRIGWLVNPQLLTYVAGGYTGAHYDSQT
jgi:outer membrane immunogenic protein